MKLINMREYSQFGRVFGPLIYMYIGGIILMTFVGCMIQFQIKQNNPNPENTNKGDQNEKKKEETVMKEKRVKEELNKCTFQPKVTPIKKINDLFRAPSNNFVKYLKIQNPKNAKLSYIDRLQTWEKNKKEKYNFL